MQTMMIIAMALSGMCIGSFINVIVYRLYHPNHSLSFLYHITFTRSHCPNCQIKLTCWQLIPIISWLLLRGRCHACQQSIAIRYLYVELLCLLLFLGIAIEHGLNSNSNSILFMLVTSWFVLLSIIDIDHYLLPDTLTQPLLWLGLLVSYLSYSSVSLEDSFIGCLIGFCLLWLPANLFHYIKGYQGLGGGDIKLLAALGTWIHYSQLPLLLVIATSLGIIYILSYRVCKKTTIAKIPFGPFILFGGWVLLIYN